MLRFNPEPDFLTTNSFKLAGAGVLCYGFLHKKQDVIVSCYMNYNVALRFLCLKSVSYIVLLQNLRSHAYMCARACMRTYTRAPTRVHSVYIATNDDKSLYNIIKSVARSCSLPVVWSSYSENNKILGIYSGKNPAAGRAGQTVGAGRLDAEMSAGAVSGTILKKWLISAVFGVPFKPMFNALMFNVIQKAQSSAVFQAAHTFFLKMFPYGKPIGVGIPPPKRPKVLSIYPVRIFFRFRTECLLSKSGSYFPRRVWGLRVLLGDKQ